MQKKTSFFLTILAAIIFIILAYYLGTQKNKITNPPLELLPIPTTTPIPVACPQDAKICPDDSTVGRVAPDCEFAPCPTTSPSPTILPTPSVKPGWKIYKNDDYGFEISYPDKYQIVEDKYGWPKAVLLLYSGGQSYDLAIEAWNSAAEYQNKYKTTNNLTVKEVKGKFITLLNTNFKDEVDQIIATFKILE